tara:strand:+ start:248 stop:1798 length:1551 start_codon:yes stop_codon:yes gene_type:complete
MDRRSFLKNSIAGLASVGLLLEGELLEAAPEVGPYGSIKDREPDENGFILPEGFKSKVIAIGGDQVEGSDYEWHLFPSGAGSIPDGSGGWFFISNSEVSNYLTPNETWGGASSIHFDASGSIIDAHPILAWSHSNAGGCATPWGTWLSCESDLFNEGKVWECDPNGLDLPIELQGVGRRNHGDIAIDKERKCLYMTENHRRGLFYRYIPDQWPNLKDGLLEALKVDSDGSIQWIEITNHLDGTIPNREKVNEGRLMAGGMGCWYEKDSVYFSTRLDNRVHSINLSSDRYEVIWDGENGRQPLTGIDDLTVDPLTGDVFVAETNGNMELVVITPEGSVEPFCRVSGSQHDFSALTGPCFDPFRKRLYISSQRAEGNRLVRDVIPAINWGVGSYGSRTGITYEISGPFRTVKIPDTSSTIPIDAPTTTLQQDVSVDIPNEAIPAIPQSVPEKIATTTSTLKLSAEKVKEKNIKDVTGVEDSNSLLVISSFIGAAIFLGAGAAAIKYRSNSLMKSDKTP